MSLIAKWNGIEWEVSRNRVAALNSISTAVELDTSTNSDAAGSPPQNTKALKAQKFNLDYAVAYAIGTDPRAEYDKCVAKIGEYAPFFLGGKQFGADKMQLVSVKIANSQINDKGVILSATISLSFAEYAPEASAKKATSGSTTSSSSSSSGKMSAIQTRVNNYTGSALSVGATTEDKAAKKPNNTQLS